MMNTEPIVTITNDSYIAKVYYDGDAESPLSEFNLSTLACWHSRYKLGNVQPNVGPIYHMLELIKDYDSEFSDSLDDKEDTEWEQAILNKFDEEFYSTELYLYDHGGITIRTYPFNCPWDSGRVGFAYVHKCAVSHMTQEQVMEAIKSEVKEYDMFLRGDVYYYTIEENDEIIDSCGSYYGFDNVIESVNSIIKTKLENSNA